MLEAICIKMHMALSIFVLNMVNEGYVETISSNWNGWTSMDVVCTVLMLVTVAREMVRASKLNMENSKD